MNSSRVFSGAGDFFFKKCGMQGKMRRKAGNFKMWIELHLKAKKCITIILDTEWKKDIYKNSLKKCPEYILAISQNWKIQERENSNLD